MLKYNFLNNIVPGNSFRRHASCLFRFFYCWRQIHFHIHVNVEVEVKTYIHLVLLIPLLKLLCHIGLHSVYRVIDKHKVDGQLKLIAGANFMLVEAETIKRLREHSLRCSRCF